MKVLTICIISMLFLLAATAIHGSLGEKGQTSGEIQSSSPPLIHVGLQAKASISDLDPNSSRPGNILGRSSPKAKYNISQFFLAKPIYDISAYSFIKPLFIANNTFKPIINVSDRYPAKPFIRSSPYKKVRPIFNASGSSMVGGIFQIRSYHGNRPAVSIT